MKQCSFCGHEMFDEQTDCDMCIRAKNRVREAIDFVRIEHCDKHNEYILEELLEELDL